MTYLSVRNVHKTYPGGKLGAVVDVSFDLEKGEIHSLVGASGSGKTTLLHMIAGLMKPDEGQVIFQGQPLENPEEQLIAGHEAIRMVYQDLELMPNMTVFENVRYPILTYDRDFQEQRVNELLQLCGLSELSDRFPRELSGGEQQRISLARALADEPGLILMDEPFSHLDPPNKERLLTAVSSIAKEEEVAVLFVTHDTMDALSISDRIGFMQEGKLVQIDTPQGIYRQPATIQVARYFGYLNYLPPYLISDEQDEDSYCRLEDISSDEDGRFEVIVSQSIYQGDRFKVKAKLERGDEIQWYDRKSYKAGENVSLTVNVNRIMRFNT